MGSEHSPLDPDRKEDAPAAGTRARDAESSGPLVHLQRLAGNSAVSKVFGKPPEQSPVHDVVGKGGQPLEKGVRSEMEGVLGSSLSGVRIHTDGAAAKSADSVGAKAFTSGRDVVFGAGQYNPASPTGKKTLAHELTHVVQQSRGPVSTTPVGGGVAVSSPSDRFERQADSVASQVGRGGPAAGAPAGGSFSAGGGAAPVQRVISDRGTDLDEAMRAVQNLPAPPPEKKGLFTRLKEGVLKLFGRQPKPSPAQAQARDVSWAAEQLQAGVDQLRLIQQTTLREKLGTPTARRETGTELIQFLTGLSRMVDVLAEGMIGGAGAGGGGLPGPVRQVKEDAEREIHMVRQLMQGGEPSTLGPGSSWFDALELMTHTRALTEGIDQAAANSDTGSLNRGNTAHTRAAYGFIKGSSQAQVQLVESTVASILSSMPNGSAPLSEDKTKPDPDVLPLVSRMLAELAPLMFPEGLGFVSGPMLDVLKGVASHTSGVRPGKGDAGAFQAEVLQKVVADIVFLRGLVPALITKKSTLANGTKAQMVMTAVSAMFQRVANGLPASTEKPTGWDLYSHTPEGAPLLSERNAFVDRILASIKEGQRGGSGSSTPTLLSTTPTPVGT